ncbi:MAG: polysaccharide biosynthesis C-terminal domain-containing protein, partial [Deltaproteobacteria bacterium]|nr:polysaccharide biosynthesis C-terminal domain-containing protein [Deltaproteobacteria bacterium]
VHVLLLSTFFYSLIFMWGYFLIATNRQMKMVLFNALGVAVNIALSIFFVKILDFGLLGIAVATTITYGLLSTIFICYVYSFYTSRVKDHFILLAQFYLPCAWVVFVVSVLHRLFPFRHVSSFQDFAIAGQMMIALVVLCLPLLYRVHKKTELFRLIFQRTA